MKVEWNQFEMMEISGIIITRHYLNYLFTIAGENFKLMNKISHQLAAFKKTPFEELSFLVSRTSDHMFLLQNTE